MNRRTQHHPARAELRGVLGKALAELGAPAPQEPVGEIRFLSEGLTYSVFHAHCRVSTDEGVDTRPLVVRYPRSDAGADQPASARRERDLLDRLAGLSLAISHPRVLDHLPPDEPSSLLHGDLLGQNLLISLDPEKQLGVIDWHEAHLGDPAYDLAVVTRGARKPFQAPGGLGRLLETYGSRSNRIVKPAQVHLFELGLHAGFCEQASRAYGAGSAGELNARQAFLSVLERASKMRGI